MPVSAAAQPTRCSLAACAWPTCEACRCPASWAWWCRFIPVSTVRDSGEALATYRPPAPPSRALPAAAARTHRPTARPSALLRHGGVNHIAQHDAKSHALAWRLHHINDEHLLLGIDPEVGA